MKEGERDSLRSPGDLCGQQVFCGTNSCTMSLNIIIWTYSLQFDNNIHYLVIFHVKRVTRMARTLARMNRMARTLARMTRTVTRMARTVTRMTRWLAHSADLSFRDTSEPMRLTTQRFLCHMKSCKILKSNVQKLYP